MLLVWASQQQFGNGSPPELVVNGNATDGTTGWAMTADTGSIAVVNGAFRVTQSGANEMAYQAITTVPGKTYAVRADLVGSGGNLAVARVLAGTAPGDATFFAQGLSGGSNSVTFVATGTTTYISLFPQTDSESAYADYDNISVKLAA